MKQSETHATRSEFWLYLKRSLKLRCPVCGISPLFIEIKNTESLTDWFEVLPGCPRCGYRYDREPGYFLFALWLINFTIASLIGVGLLLLLESYFDLSTPQLIIILLTPIWALGILSARHTKAIFLALDHLIHPHDEKK
ncbi:MAG: DUF983 domain-containing protein [Chloroflexota bacterium]